MSDPRFEPEYVGPDETGTRLVVRWKDGAVSEFTPRFLRLNCRCARCVDEMTGIRTLSPATVPEDVYPLAIRAVGRYALGVTWSDGHDTGIYSYELLRRLGDESSRADSDSPTGNDAAS